MPLWNSPIAVERICYQATPGANVQAVAAAAIIAAADAMARGAKVVEVSFNNRTLIMNPRYTTQDVIDRLMGKRMA